MKIKLTLEDRHERLVGTRQEYEKYVSPLINLANGFAHATRPKHVGQLSEIIRECPARDYEGWCEWYLKRYPTAIDEATDRVVSMLERLRNAMETIDRTTVRSWVTELVLEKTYVGLRVERVILEKAADKLGRRLRLSSPEDESRGVDGYLDEQPVSVKPDTYKTMGTLSETIDARMIYYEKKTNGTIVADLADVEAP